MGATFRDKEIKTLKEERDNAVNSNNALIKIQDKAELRSQKEQHQVSHQASWLIDDPNNPESEIYQKIQKEIIETLDLDSYNITSDDFRMKEAPKKTKE